MSDLERERDDWKQRALDSESLLKQTAIYADSQKQRAEAAEKHIQKYANELCSERTENLNLKKACAEMREAFKSFECTICDENHKFRAECNACLSGEPSACTCCNEELVDCPCCMEGEYAEGYRKLREAIKDGAGAGYLSPAEVKEKIRPLLSCIQWMVEHAGGYEHQHAIETITYAQKEGLI